MSDALNQLAGLGLLFGVIANVIVERNRLRTNTSKLDKTYLGLQFIVLTPLLLSLGYVSNTTDGGWRIFFGILFIIDIVLFSMNAFNYAVAVYESKRSHGDTKPT